MILMAAAAEASVAPISYGTIPKCAPGSSITLANSRKSRAILTKPTDARSLPPTTATSLVQLKASTSLGASPTPTPPNATGTVSNSNARISQP